MAQSAGRFLWIQEMCLHCRPVSIVAHPALAQNGVRVRVNLTEAIALVTIEASAFKSKPPSRVYLVTLGALHPGKRRVLVKRRETSGKVATYKKPDLFFSALPKQCESMSAWANLDDRVKHVRKRLCG